MNIEECVDLLVERIKGLDLYGEINIDDFLKEIDNENNKIIPNVLEFISKVEKKIEEKRIIGVLYNNSFIKAEELKKHNADEINEIVDKVQVYINENIRSFPTLKYIRVLEIKEHYLEYVLTIALGAFDWIDITLDKRNNNIFIKYYEEKNRHYKVIYSQPSIYNALSIDEVIDALKHFNINISATEFTEYLFDHKNGLIRSIEITYNGGNNKHEKIN